QVEAVLASKFADSGVLNGKSVCERRVSKIFSRTLDGTLINIDGFDNCFRKSLCKHQGNDAGTSADIQDSMGLFLFGTDCEQHSIRVDLHGATGLVDIELLETKYIFHIIKSPQLVFTNQ